jgi:hypothetical protein
MEIIRRILLLVGVLSGVFAWAYSRPVLISVSVVDFAENKARAESMPTGFLHKDKSLEEFFDSRTEGRRLRIDTDEMAEFYRRIRAATVEQQIDAELQPRKGEREHLGRVYYTPSDPAIATVLEDLSPARPLLYVQVRGDGPDAPTLAFTRHDTADLMGDAPANLQRPYRSQGKWLLLFGFVCYVFIPRRRREPDEIHCARASAIVLPDMLGLAMAAVFFGLPILIVQSNGATMSMDSGAWLVPIIVCWFLVLFPLIILGIAAHNASYGIRMGEQSLTIRKWFGHRSIAFDDVERVDAIAWRTPGWLRTIAWIIVMFARNGAIAALMLEGGRGSGIQLEIASGRRQRIWTSGIVGWDRIVTTLEQHGVPIDPAVKEGLQELA